MSSEMQDCLFPNLGILINMKPTYVFFLYSIPGKAYRLRHVDGKARTCLVMSSYLIFKAMRLLYVFNNIIYQKYEPTQSSNFRLKKKTIGHLFYVGPIDIESPEDMKKKTLIS